MSITGDHQKRRRLRDPSRWLPVVLSTILALSFTAQPVVAAAKKAAAKKPAAKGGGASAAKAKEIAEKAAGAFSAFCDEWMGKLATRERDNKAQIKWQTNASGTTGEYIGYSQEHTCQIKEQTEPTTVPIGTITYRELRYQKAGTTQAEATASEPRVVEIVETIEIFRFSNGKWVY